MESVCNCQLFAIDSAHFSLFDHMYQIDSAQGPSGGIKFLKPEHRPDNPLDGLVILFEDIVQLFDLANFDE